MLPLIVANSMVGALLFNIYGMVQYNLFIKDKKFNYYQSFLAGFSAGSLQTILSTPLENIQRAIPILEMVEKPNESMIRVTIEAIKKTLRKHEKGMLERFRFLYHSFYLNFIKDGLGFMVFFGTFECTMHIGSLIYVKKFTPRQIICV
jgi:hypothetical protein